MARHGLATGAAQAQKGADWVETVVGWTVQVLRATHRFTRYWVPNDSPKDQIDWSQYLPEPGFHVLPRASTEVGRRAHIRLVAVQSSAQPRR